MELFTISRFTLGNDRLLVRCSLWTPEFRPGIVPLTKQAESFFALIKRGHYGVYHQMSKKHLHRYCSEYEFRWTHRKVSDSERMEAVIRQVGGKRLMYETPDAKIA